LQTETKTKDVAWQGKSFSQAAAEIIYSSEEHPARTTRSLTCTLKKKMNKQVAVIKRIPLPHIWERYLIRQEANQLTTRQRRFQTVASTDTKITIAAASCLVNWLDFFPKAHT